MNDFVNLGICKHDFKFTCREAEELLQIYLKQCSVVFFFAELNLQLVKKNHASTTDSKILLPASTVFRKQWLMS